MCGRSDGRQCTADLKVGTYTADATVGTYTADPTVGTSPPTPRSALYRI